jgi:zinc transport system substrate-binding protein
MDINMKKRKISMVFIALIFALSLLPMVGCNEESGIEKGKSQKVTIAVSIVPEKAFAEAVCGELAEVVSMIPPGASPENYEPTPKEIEKFNNASIYFAIGVAAETANILPKAREIQGMKIVQLQDQVAKVYPEREFAPGERDPHIWLSPKRAKIMVEIMEQEMSKLDVKNKEQYRKNAQKYIEELDKLDKQIKTALEGVKDKKFIVFHPAFGYLADDYNLKMYALEQEGKEATPQHLQAMIDFARKENIKTIFYQAEIDSKQSQSFAEEIGGKTIQLDPLSLDYIKSLREMSEIMAEVMK